MISPCRAKLAANVPLFSYTNFPLTFLVFDPPNPSLFTAMEAGVGRT